MLKLSKERHEDSHIFLFDVRPANIASELGVPHKVCLGRIDPPEEEPGLWRWESRWGANCGEEPSLEAARIMLEKCAKGMYR